MYTCKTGHFVNELRHILLVYFSATFWSDYISLSLYPYIYLSLYLSIFLSLYIFIFLYISISLHIPLSISLSIHVSINISQVILSSLETSLCVYVCLAVEGMYKCETRHFGNKPFFILVGMYT